MPTDAKAKAHNYMKPYMFTRNQVKNILKQLFDPGISNIKNIYRTLGHIIILFYKLIL